MLVPFVRRSNRSMIKKLGEYDLFGDSLMKFFGWRPDTFGSSGNTHFLTCLWCDQRETGDSSSLLSNQEIKAFRQECPAFFAHFGNILYFMVPVATVWNEEHSHTLKIRVWLWAVLFYKTVDFLSRVDYSSLFITDTRIRSSCWCLCCWFFLWCQHGRFTVIMTFCSVSALFFF